MSDTFQHKSRTFQLTIEHDDAMGAPWNEHDGHGSVRIKRHDETKRAGERVLYDGDNRSYTCLYDWAGAIQEAKKGGWNISDEAAAKRAETLGRPLTRGERTAAAVEDDFERLRAWCNDEWSFVVVGVTLLDDDGEPVGETEYLGGVEDSEQAYVLECAHELAEQICWTMDKARAELDTLADAYGCELVEA